jgi:hypothetical protein
MATSTYVVRIWIPDRPGALGAVASRIGSVRGDLVGIDILERGAGMTIDELVVQLPDESLVPLLLKEIGEVDGVAVEDIRPAAGGAVADPRLAALETAALIVEQSSSQDVLNGLVLHAAHDFDASWAVVIDADGAVVHAAVGTPPPSAWIAAFVAGSRTASASVGSDDTAWARLDRADLDVVLGRPGRPVRDRERLQLNALARIADLRWADLARGTALRAHPSAV